MALERFHSLSLEQMTPEQRDVAKRILSGSRTELTGPFPALLANPRLADTVQAVGEQLRFHSALPPRLTELAILICARHWTSQFEWYFHRRLALEAGLDSAIIDRIAEGREPEGMQPHDRIVHDYCKALLETGTASEEATEALVSAFGDHGMIDLIGLVGYYCLISMVLNVVDFPLPPGVEALKPLTPQ